LPGPAGLAPLADPQYRRLRRVPSPDPPLVLELEFVLVLTRAGLIRFIDCPVRFQANRLKNFFPSEWHREHQIVYVKADLSKVAGRYLTESESSVRSLELKVPNCSLGGRCSLNRNLGRSCELIKAAKSRASC
jgi:hypothetical protein